jgi:primosomal protein N'
MKNISSKKAALMELTKADVIIGTKMITTGFDFAKIGLIGVILVE